MAGPRHESMLLPIARITSGVLLGLAGLGLFAGTVAARDAGMLWLVLDVGLVVLGAAIVAVGFAALREMHARSTLVRGWATVGAALLLILALFISLD
jgi:hypothetical protein